MARVLQVGWVTAAILLAGTAGTTAVSSPGPESPTKRESLHGAAASDPEKLTITLPGDVPLVMVRIRAGTYTMGSPDTEVGRSSEEGPQHEVTISRDFYLGAYEVTQAQWEAVMDAARPEGCDDYGVGDDYPVYCVALDDVCGTGETCGESGGFLEKLNDHLVDTGQHENGTVRLPTEAEWEYAARAGTTTRFSFGEVSECTDPCGACATFEHYMWWCGNAYYNTATRGARPVGEKLPNPWGLFDVHGNVWELVEEVFAAYDSSPQTDPVGPSLGWPHVARGGGWGMHARSCRSARRGKFLPPDTRYRSYQVGLRLAASP